MIRASQRSLQRVETSRTRTIGDYLLLEPLGSGGSSVVYRAYERNQGLEAAIKVLRPEVVQRSPKIEQRFLREIALVRKLDHPGVVKLLDFGRSATGLLWMTLELVRGVSLIEVLRSQAPLDPPRVKRLMLKLLDALGAAHRAGIIHRDLKPSNVMVTRDEDGEEHIKLLDFGLSRALAVEDPDPSREITGPADENFGTPRYMAPELLRRRDLGPHSDVYSAGLIMFELLTGTQAICGSNSYEVIVKQFTQPLRLPDHFEETMHRLQARAVAKDWSHRFPNALAFAAALEKVAFELPVEEAIEVELEIPLACTNAVVTVRHPPCLDDGGAPHPELCGEVEDAEEVEDARPRFITSLAGGLPDLSNGGVAVGAATQEARPDPAPIQRSEPAPDPNVLSPVVRPRSVRRREQEPEPDVVVDMTQTKNPWLIAALLWVLGAAGILSLGWWLAATA